jgi:hypothetical protein
LWWGGGGAPPPPTLQNGREAPRNFLGTPSPARVADTREGRAGFAV